MHESPASVRHVVVGIHPPVAAQAQAGEEIHALLVGPVDQDLERIESSRNEALHVLPAAPLVGALKGLAVGAPLETDLRGVEQAVPTGDPIAEGVDCRPGHLIDRDPGILHPHRGIVDEQVVVTGVIEVDGAAAAHDLHHSHRSVKGLHQRDPAHCQVLTGRPENSSCSCPWRTPHEPFTSTCSIPWGAQSGTS